jgi:hypothetical protein
MIRHNPCLVSADLHAVCRQPQLRLPTLNVALQVATAALAQAKVILQVIVNSEKAFVHIRLASLPPLVLLLAVHQLRGRCDWRRRAVLPGRLRTRRAGRE